MRIFALLTVAAFVSLSPAASADEHQVVQDISAECTTKPTGPDGVRHWCDLKETTLRAPAGHVLVEESLEGGRIYWRGTNEDCRCVPDFDGYVEVVPNTGIMAATVLTLKGHARGPRGAFAGTGHVTCRYSVTMVRLPEPPPAEG